jgi:hypothetical protein
LRWVCFDKAFPEAARCLAVQGAQMILCPTAWPSVEKTEDWKNCRNRSGGLLQFFLPLFGVKNKGFYTLRDGHVPLVDQSHRPHRVLGEGDHAEVAPCHVGKDEVHRCGVGLALLTKLVTEAETARVEVGVDGDTFSGGCVEQQMADQKVIIFEDNRFFQRLADRDLLPIVKAASRMDDEVDFLREQRKIGQRGISCFDGGHADVILAVQNLLPDVGIRKLCVIQMHGRVAVREGMNERGRQVPEDAVGGDEFHEPQVLGFQIVNILLRLVALLEDADGMIVEDLPILCHVDAALTSKQKIGAHFLFHAPDRLADALRCHEKVFCRLRNTVVIADLHKVAKIGYVHGLPPRDMPKEEACFQASPCVRCGSSVYSFVSSVVPGCSASYGIGSCLPSPM